MKLIGCWGSLCLRFAQCIFSALVLILSALNPVYYMVSAFRLLNIASTIQMIWEIALCFYDSRIRRHGNRRLDSGLLTVLVIGDWVVGGIALGAASSSAAVMMYFARDTTQCYIQTFECKMGAACVAFAYCGWFCSAVTAVNMFWIRASL